MRCTAACLTTDAAATTLLLATASTARIRLVANAALSLPLLTATATDIAPTTAAAAVYCRLMQERKLCMCQQHYAWHVVILAGLALVYYTYV
jgi:hypothetical protein